MALFNKKTSYLGIDLGSSSVKIVELENFNSRPRLVTYGFTEKNLSEWNGDGSLGAIEDMANVVKEVCQKSRATSLKVVGALSNFSVFTSVINLPEMSKKELASAISWEAKKIIPLPLEDIILDWKILEDEAAPTAAPGAEANNQINKTIFAKPQKNLKILLTGAGKGLVKKYMDIFAKAGLNLLSLETENFALVRSLIGNDKSTVALIDFGASTSSIAIVEKGVPVFSRSIEQGGLMLTRAISTSLNVNLDRAEQFKQDLALETETAGNSLPQLVEKSLATIINEIKYTINTYQEQQGKKVEKVILSGGSALLGNLPGYLSRVLGLNVHVGDPWARVIYPTELRPILDRLGARFAVAIGLAMRNIE